MGRGWEVACRTGARHQAASADPQTVDGIVFHRTPHRAGGPPLLREWREVRALGRRLDQLMTEWKPDQLHVHSPLLNALAAQGVARRRAFRWFMRYAPSGKTRRSATERDRSEEHTSELQS